MPSKKPSAITVLVDGLTRHINQDPKNPNAGNFAVAIASVYSATIVGEQYSQLWEKIRGDVELICDGAISKLREHAEDPDPESKRKKPLTKEERRAAAARFVKQSVAASVATALIHEAAGFERLAELGREPHGQVTAGVSERPTFTEAQRKKYREHGTELRERATQLLSESGIENFPLTPPHAMNWAYGA